MARKNCTQGKITRREKIPELLEMEYMESPEQQVLLGEAANKIPE